MTSDERLREEQTNPFKLFVCVQCGFEYDEAKGWPEDGIAPGTRWDDSPTTGAAPIAARRNPISRWWRSRARDG